MKQPKSKKGLRILKLRTPKGKNVKHYVKEKPARASCARCSMKLQGVQRAIPSVLRAMTRSKRRVNRKFGGVLCGTCVKEVEKYKTRMECGYAVRRDLTIEKFLPTGWYTSLPSEVQSASKALSSKARAKNIVVRAEGAVAEKQTKRGRKSKAGEPTADELAAEEPALEGSAVKESAEESEASGTPKEKKPKKKAKKAE